MKKLIIIFTMLIMVVSSCSLEEEPPFLANQNVYSTGDNATKALDGIYAAVGGYFLYGNIYYFVNSLYSGMMVTRRGSGGAESIYNANFSSFTVSNGMLDLETVWNASYVAIARANDAIKSAVPVTNPATQDDLVINDVIGQAYFVRAFLYFNLVSLWGEVPLRLEPTTPASIHLAKSSRKVIFDQIIADTEMALQYMNGEAGGQYARPYAANMLLAKVYMSLATAPAELQDGTTNYWQAAYDQAIQVYGQYSLVPNYGDLFNEKTSDGTSESIFEIQVSDGASSDWVRSYSPNNWLSVSTFGRLQVNADMYEMHAAAYPADPRIAETFVSTYTQMTNGSTKKVYPDRSRNNFGNAHPYFLKFAEKDQTAADLFTNKNIILYRYGELLIMLAEISNELQNGEQTSYIEELLTRVGLTPQAGYSGTQDDFRNAVMQEYQYELMGEGQDCINIRRRGYDWFKTNVIDVHNNNPLFDPVLDVTFAEGEQYMFLPIPATEVNINQEIN